MTQLSFDHNKLRSSTEGSAITSFESQSYYDDEIDLFELAETLWAGKWIIAALVAVSLSFASLYLFVATPKYQSKLWYAVDTLPPFYGSDRASLDFQKLLYSEPTFESWRKGSSASGLSFEDFSRTEVFEGYVFEKDEADQLVLLDDERNKGAFVLIKSNDPAMLNDFFDYANHVNGLVGASYVERAKEELSLVETRFSDLMETNDSIIRNILTLDRYIAAAENGSEALTIQRPTIPEKVSPKTSLTLALAIVLGGMVGAAWVLLRKAINNRKQLLGA